MAPMLIKIAGNSATAQTAFASFGMSAVSVEPILQLEAPAGQGLAEGGATWLRVSDGATTMGARGDRETAAPIGLLFDEAHELFKRLRAEGHAVLAVEPDIEQTWPSGHAGPGGLGFAVDAAQCTFEDQETSGGRPAGPGAAWHLGSNFSDLAAARAAVPAADQAKVRIAHLDTGYDDDHKTKPRQLDSALAYDFVDNKPGAIDRIVDGQWFSNRGHGTATLALLAGADCQIPNGAAPPFKGDLGGAPDVTVIPVRIADWVVRFTTSSMVAGINHAIEKGAHVVSMSMGGVPSQALADAVNLAWEKGVVMVTAAGNNFARFPVPSIVYPARYERVIAACGVMANGRAYTGLAFGTMQGNHGPRSKMDTALAAFTPNAPWAAIGCRDLVTMNGAGTSAATPQIAAAAALWIAKHLKTLDTYPEKWMRVAAVRQALFASAKKSTNALNADETQRLLGQGVLQANDALKVKPAKANALAQLKPESTWPLWILNVIGDQFGVAGGGVPKDLLALELMQLSVTVPSVAAAFPSDATDVTTANDPAVRAFLEAALDTGRPSKALRAWLEAEIGRASRGLVPYASKTRVKRKLPPAPQPRRRLRVYALDPALAKQLETLPINETVIELPWEELKPGPIGDYIEVVDVDPATGRVYDPVDLIEPTLLAERGHTPSEGNPAFHQQMVYAVAMKTIATFERALGRRVLWATPPFDGAKGKTNTPTRRLRIYPHALRAANAYYSPDKVALMFGYFPSTGGTHQSTPRGSMVFTCLSSDIIAHEMTHAILDGMHRRFQDRSNPDVAAFHEGFSDIISIFHHFTIPELVRFEIAKARGQLSAATLLGGLAGQFGDTTRDIGGALRNYLSEPTRSRRYGTTLKAHDRGEILVLAVYDAFLAIVNHRTADLIRIATGGTGILAQGALHPDLVERLTQETIKSAEHVLRICIRAIDYVPAADITFGDYLRALITADVDFMPDDPLGYRVAFMQSFRQRGIPVRDVRTFSVETLIWNMPQEDKPATIVLAPGEWGNREGKTPKEVNWLNAIFQHVRFDFERTADFDQLANQVVSNQWKVWSVLNMHFRKFPDELQQFGLIPRLPKYASDGKLVKKKMTNVDGELVEEYTAFSVYNVRPSVRVTPDGGLQRIIVFTIEQRRPVFLDFKNNRLVPRFDYKPGDQVAFWQRGGATVVLDDTKGDQRIRYIITKSMGSERRLQIQMETLRGGTMASLRESYFGESHREPFAFLHMNHEDDADGQGHGHHH